MIDTGFLLALAGAVLGAASMVLHVVAPRTKNTVDDQLRDDIDEVLAFIRGQQPPPTGTAVVAPPASSTPSSAAKAGTVATIALLAAMIGSVSLAPACHTLGPAAADGLVAAIDCEATHFSTQMLVDATKLADAEVQHWLASGAAASTTAVAADLAPFDSDAKKCALAGILAGATAALASSSSNSSSGSGSGSQVATQGLSAQASLAPTASSAAGGPEQVRTVVSAAARQAGWPLIKVAGGTVL